MEIKASMTYSPQVAKAFVQFSRYRNKNQKRNFAMWIVILLFVSMGIILLGFAVRVPEVITLGLVPIFVIFSMIYERFFKKPHIAKGKEQHVPTYYTFRDESFWIERCLDLCQVKQKVQYKDLDLVLENKDYFCLVMEGGGSIIEKATVQGGLAEDIQRTISPYLGEKYVILNF